MSIYPVPLQKWFPNPKEHPVYSDQDHSILRMIVKLSRCDNCGKHCKYNRAWGHHSLPYGYGEVWCSEKCLYGPKKRKKKRREKRLRGRKKRLYTLMDKELAVIMKEQKTLTEIFKNGTENKS